MRVVSSFVVRIFDAHHSKCISDIRSLAIDTTHPEVEMLSSPSYLASITPPAEAGIPDNSSGAPDSYQLHSPLVVQQHLHHPQPVYWGTMIVTEPYNLQHRPSIDPTFSEQDSARPSVDHLGSTFSPQPIHNDSFQPYSSNNAMAQDSWRILR